MKQSDSYLNKNALFLQSYPSLSLPLTHSPPPFTPFFSVPFLIVFLLHISSSHLNTPPFHPPSPSCSILFPTPPFAITLPFHCSSSHQTLEFHSRLVHSQGLADVKVVCWVCCSDGEFLYSKAVFRFSHRQICCKISFLGRCHDYSVATDCKILVSEFVN